MAANVVACLCIFGFLVSSTYSQCLPVRPSNCGVYSARPAYSESPLVAAAALTAAHGGGFTVTSASPVSPHGVSVLSENEYSGLLPVVGFLPLLGTTQLDGAVPTAGAGVVTYGCGYGDVGIRSEDFASSVLSVGYSNGLISGGGINDLRIYGCVV